MEKYTNVEAWRIAKAHAARQRQRPAAAGMIEEATSHAVIELKADMSVTQLLMSDDDDKNKAPDIECHITLFLNFCQNI